MGGGVDDPYRHPVDRDSVCYPRQMLAIGHAWEGVSFDEWDRLDLALGYLSARNVGWGVHIALLVVVFTFFSAPKWVIYEREFFSLALSSVSQIKKKKKKPEVVRCKRLAADSVTKMNIFYSLFLQTGGHTPLFVFSRRG